MAKPARLSLLDGLRGIAAVAVVVHHESGLYGTPWPLPRAYLAVDFFFMLSGLVITGAYEPRLRAGLGVARFMWLRVKRLWPMLALGVAIGGGRAMATGQPGAALLTLREIVLFPGLAGWGGIYRLNGPQWSVVFELFANALHALVLVHLGRRGVFGVAIAAGIAFAMAIAHWDGAAMGDITANWWGGFARVGFSYALGVWLGRIWGARDQAMLSPRWWWLAALPVPVMLVAMPFAPLPRAWGDGVAVFGLIAPALWLAAHATLPPRIEKACVWLGALSFPIYALHVPVLVAAKALNAAVLHMPVGAGRALGFAATLALAMGAQWVMEGRRRAQPLNTNLRKMT